MNYDDDDDDADMEYSMYSSSAYEEASRIAEARSRAEANRQRALFNLSMSRGRADISSGRAFRPRRTFDTSSNEPRDAR